MTRPKPLALRPSRDAQRAQAGKRAGLDDKFRLERDHNRFKKIEHFDFGAHRIVHVPALRMRAFRSGAVIFRLENIATRRNVLYDAMLFFRRVELAFNTPKKHRAEQDGNNAGDLCIGHAEESSAD